METNSSSKFALAVLEMVNKKKEEIKTLTSEIIALEDDPKNLVKIKQNVQSVLNAVACCSNSTSNDLELVKLSADIVFNVLRMCASDENHTAIKREAWGVLITHQLEDFCIFANAWNPVKFDFGKKGWKIEFKNLNIGGIIGNK